MNEHEAQARLKALMDERARWRRAWIKTNPEKALEADGARKLRERAKKAIADAVRGADGRFVFVSRDAARMRANPEKAKAAKKAWKLANPEKVKAAKKAWQRANPEKVKAAYARQKGAKVRTRAEWDAARMRANPEKAKAAKKAWKLANPEKVKAAKKAWQRANPKKVKAAYARQKERAKAEFEAWRIKNPHMWNEEEIPREKLKTYVLHMRTRAEWRAANPDKAETLDRLSAVMAERTRWRRAWIAAHPEELQEILDAVPAARQDAARKLRERAKNAIADAVRGADGQFAFVSQRVLDRKAKQMERDADGTPMRTIVGIDGEGLNEDGKHKYLYMAAWTEDRSVGELDLDPLYACEPRTVRDGGDGPHADAFAAARTKACLDFILSMPSDALVFGYSLGYDYTKILEGMSSDRIYKLARPELRPGPFAPRGVFWGAWELEGRTGQYRLNYMKGKLTVARVVDGEHTVKCARGPRCRGCKIGKSRVVHDIFTFFQGSFIKACREWGVVTEEEYQQLASMKAKRGQFTRAEWEEVKTYCGLECRKLARLGGLLLAAHNQAELPLKNYYGAGSTAAAVLKRFRARDFMGETPPEMELNIAQGFFGGRFELSRIGPIRAKIWSYDIASAYPYQFTFLPCLKCGTWERVRGPGLQQAVTTAAAALVRYSLPVVDSLGVQGHTSSAVWGPFPLRAHGLGHVHKKLSDGCILYPASSGGGWVYKDEFLAGQKHFPNVGLEEAWIYQTTCDHSPFNDQASDRLSMPDLYRLRLEWGKEGRGIVTKLGANACFGKTAQSIGKTPPYQNFLWAGMITSGCRAQLLELMARAKDPASILTTATDGLLSLEALACPEPRDTGTLEAARAKGKGALGSWELKEIDGLMNMRPGISFPLDAKIEAEVKARGVGKAVLASHRAGVLAQWERAPGKAYVLDRPQFHGMKTATDPPRKGERYASRRAVYGRWSDQESVVSYSTLPKRPPLRAGAPLGSVLSTWALDSSVVSAPYERLLCEATRAARIMARLPMAGPTPDAQAMARARDLRSEQPLYDPGIEAVDGEL